MLQRMHDRLLRSGTVSQMSVEDSWTILSVRRRVNGTNPGRRETRRRKGEIA